MTIVFTMMTLIVAVAVPIYRSAIEVAEEKTAIEDIESIAKAVETFRLTNGVLPETLIDIGMGNRVDPWGNFYIYRKMSDSHEAAAGRTLAEGLPSFDRVAPGQFAFDFDGDGRVDLQTGALAPDIVAELKATTRERSIVGTQLNTDFELFSPGRDGKAGVSAGVKIGKDDIIRGRNGGFIDRSDRYQGPELKPKSGSH